MLYGQYHQFLDSGDALLGGQNGESGVTNDTINVFIACQEETASKLMLHFIYSVCQGQLRDIRFYLFQI